MRALSSLLVCEYLDIPADVYASSFYPPSCPKCRPLHPKQSFFTVFWRGGLHFGRHSPQTACGAGGIALHEGATRRRHAVRGPRVVQNPPHHPRRRAPRRSTVRLGHQGTAAQRDTNSQWSGPTVSLRRLGATAGPEATSWTQYGRQTDQQEAPRSDVQLGSTATRIVPSPEICILCSPPLKSVC